MHFTFPLRRIELALSTVAFLSAPALAAPTTAAPKTQHVVMIVWDGLRPDSVTRQNTPVLFQLAQNGVTFTHHHPVYPSSTEVNGTALSTGMIPARGGIIGNKEYRPDINPLKSVATEDLETVREGDAKGDYLCAATVAEIVQRAGGRTAIAGTKPVALLLDRAETRTSAAAQNSTDVFEGKAAPASALSGVVAAQGEFPPTIEFPNTKQDSWTTAALTQTLWKTDVPKFSVLWLSDVDYSQHETAPGAPTALAALKSCDAQLATVLKALDAKGVRDTTSVFVVSDHGFSTISRAVDIETVLQNAGFSAKSKLKSPLQKGEVFIVGLGGSVFFYVGGHDAIVTRRLVEFLQSSDFCGVLMTRTPAPGTFGLDKVGINSAKAPDVAMSFRWNSDANEFGVAGTINADFKRKVGQGSHASLSRFDMHNTLIASGPDFRRGFVDEMPSGNTDLAPTILRLLGLTSPHPMDGRILGEALLDSGKAPVKVEAGKWQAQNTVGGRVFHQYIAWKKAGDTLYFDEGNSDSPAAP